MAARERKAEAARILVFARADKRDRRAWSAMAFGASCAKIGNRLCAKTMR
jgi:hypothetical protein